MSAVIRALLSAFTVLVLSTPAWAETLPGTAISNTAQAEFSLRQGSPVKQVESNTQTDVVIPLPTPATARFLRYQPGAPGATPYRVGTTRYSTTGQEEGPFQNLPAPVTHPGSVPVNLDKPVDLLETEIYLSGDPLFLELTDLDQNLHYDQIDTVLVTISSSTGDTEVLILKESGPNTGVFVGYIQSSRIAGPHGDGTLFIEQDGTIRLGYVDNDDPTDLASANALFDPAGTVFDSQTGDPVDGVAITIIDTATGQPAIVYGDDGISRFPSTVNSGGTVTDSSGAVYRFPPGGYRFPLMGSGTYQLDISPVQGYAAPSEETDDTLQKLPGAPWALDQAGSRGQPFTLPPLPIFKIDIPVDPVENTIWTEKTAQRARGAIGDFIPYSLRVTNSSSRGRVDDVNLYDRLPLGFRYQKGSARVDDLPVTPSISSDGRSLTFNLGSLESAQVKEIFYVTEIAAGARLGKAINSALAIAKNDLKSNTAKATVRIEDDFMRQTSILVGRVTTGECEDDPKDPVGVAGVRIYLEDGTYVVTDDEGRYHVEGLEPGGHVVQLDPVSYQDTYEAVICDSATRHAGRGWSQFIDLQPGTLWRANFLLRQRPPVQQADALSPSTSGAVDTSSGQQGTLLLGLNHQADENGLIQLELPLKVNKATASNVRVSVILPPDIAYEPGSSQKDASTIADPDIMATTLSYRLGDLPADSSHTLQLKVKQSAVDQNKGAPVLAMLTLDTAEQKNKRTGLLTSVVGSSDSAAKGQTTHEQELVFRPLVPSDPGGNETESSPRALRTKIFAEGFIEEATGGYEWLWPPATYYPAVPSIKVAVKHDAQHSVRFLLNEKPVNPLNFEGTKQNAARTTALSQWNGVDLLDGDNHLRVEMTDRTGTIVQKEDRVIHYSLPPVDAVLLADKSSLVADSLTPSVLAIRLLDGEGHPAREGIMGEFRVQPPYSAADSHFSDGTMAGLARQDEKSRFIVTEDGIAYIRIAPTSHAGEVEVILPLAEGDETIKTWLTPAQRDWILVGFAEGTVGYNTFSGNEVSLKEAGIDEHYYDDGQVKFFAKGAIRGDWLLTMAYDSDKPDLDGDSLYQIIDPDAYYPLYGDSSGQGYEAASAHKIYLKLERDQFYALFGDMNTGLNQTELSRYNRNMSGFKSEMQTYHFSYTMFAADTKQAFVKDEIRGDGTSGLYYLTQKGLVINSEEITLETRDRFRSEVITNTVTLHRHTDYDIDYDNGSLFFKRPVPSRDDKFDPIFIVARYETYDSDDENFNYGGRAAVKVLDQKVEVGASYVHEGRGAGEGDLYGVDATAQLTPQTSLHLEAARTENEFFDEAATDEAYLAELSHETGRLNALAYYREHGEHFGLGQQNTSESGTRKFGAEASYHFTPKFSLAGLVYRERVMSNDNERDVAELDARYLAGRYSIHSGLRHAKDRLGDGSSRSSEQLLFGGNWVTADRKLTMRADHEQSLSRNKNTDYPTRTTLGLDYQLNRRINAFAEQELTWGSQQDTQNTRVGLNATPWQGGEVRSTVERQMSENSQRVFAIFGLGQTWRINERWSTDVSLDRSYTLSSHDSYQLNEKVPPAQGSDDDFTSVSVGSTYSKAKWTWWNRLETRQADSMDKYGISTSVVAEPQDGIAVSAKALAFITDISDGARRTDGNVRLGLAYRPAASRWILLNRLDFYFDRTDHSDDDYDNWRIVNNLHANYRLNRNLQMSFYYGLKYVRDHYNGSTYSGYTDLASFETRYNINERWDVGAHGSVLHSWNSDTLEYCAGADIGYSPMTNTWISLGYNVVGFEDEDFSAAHYTAQGAYMRFRAKFDQQSVRDAAAWMNK